MLDRKIKTSDAVRSDQAGLRCVCCFRAGSDCRKVLPRVLAGKSGAGTMQISGCITPKDSTMTDRNVSADSAPRMESRHPTGRMPSSVDGRIAMPAPVREVRGYCESMGEDLDDFESDVGANYKLRYEVQEINTASEGKMSTLTLLQSDCFLTD